MRVDGERTLRFTLLTRHGCHLCEEMAAVVEPVLAGYEIELHRTDVDADPALVERFGDIVPVLIRDGKVVAKVKITARQAHRLVRRRRSWVR